MVNKKEWKVCRVCVANPGSESGHEAEQAAEKFATYLTEMEITPGEVVLYLQRISYASTLTFLVYTDKEVRDLEVGW